MKTELLLIRHGETDWNTERRLQGHLDIAMNPEGRRQAQALAGGLMQEKLAAIISSDLQRAVQTAGEIGRLQGLPTRLDAHLRERCFGGFEGHTYSELPEIFPQAYAHWKSRDPDFHFPPKQDDVHNCGESIREFHRRVMRCIAHYGAHYAGQKIAIIAHGGVLECAYRQARGLALNAEREKKIFNASINRFVWENQTLKLVQWGDVAHLEQAILDEIT